MSKTPGAATPSSTEIDEQPALVRKTLTREMQQIADAINERVALPPQITEAIEKCLAPPPHLEAVKSLTIRVPSLTMRVTNFDPKEFDLLAKRYGWSHDQILNMTPEQIRMYLDVIATEVQAALPRRTSVNTEAATSDAIHSVVEKLNEMKAGDASSDTPRKRARKRPRKAESKVLPLTAAESEAVHLVGEHKGNFTKAGRAAGKSRQAMAKFYKKAMTKLGKTANTKPKTQSLTEDRRGQVDLPDRRAVDPNRDLDVD